MTRGRRAFHAWVLLVGLLTFPLAPLAGHASSRAYHAGHGSGEVPEPPPRVAPLLLFDEPSVVYATYGRVWLVAFATFLAAALVLRRDGAQRLPRGGRRATALIVAGLAANLPGNVGDYWLGRDVLGQVLHGASFLLTLIGILLVTLGSVWLGALALRRGALPRPAAVAFLLAPAGFLVNALLVPNAPAAYVPVLALPWMALAASRLRAA